MTLIKLYVCPFVPINKKQNLKRLKHLHTNTFKDKNIPFALFSCTLACVCKCKQTTTLIIVSVEWYLDWSQQRFLALIIWRYLCGKIFILLPLTLGLLMSVMKGHSGRQTTQICFSHLWRGSTYQSKFPMFKALFWHKLCVLCGRKYTYDRDQRSKKCIFAFACIYIWDRVIYGAIVSRVPFPSICPWGKQGKHNPRPYTSLRQGAKMWILLCVENAGISDNRNGINTYKEEGIEV